MLADITSKLYSLIVGGLFMLVVYHLLLFVQNKKTIYLQYAGYMFFISLYIFNANFTDVLGRFLHNFNGTFLCLSFAFYFQLSRTILDTKVEHPRLGLILKSGILILVVASILFPVVAIAIGYKFYVHSFDAFAVFLTFYCCVIYFYLYKIKTIYARFILVGSLLYFGCSIIVLFIGIFVGSKAFLEIYGFNIIIVSYIGFTLEALVFALLIGYRTKAIEIGKIISEAKYNVEKEKVVTLLKEQEINSINAMISGQEKERKKLAEDLHDSVGATLAAAKLQFNHLSQHRDQMNEMDDLFSKTSSLLDDAYNEIRAMAHLKNSGVIAKNGLLPALQKLAKNASSTNGLQVTVENFGLEQRLDNIQEITIFRIIQELITNIIKHAEATEASVSLTPHENELNVIIEDNGKGFDPRKIIDQGGMGLANIERRIEYIEGTMEVDSTPGNGTTILIDIPI